MELNDLKKSVSECSFDELRELLSGIRSNRRVPKKPPTSVKKKPQTTLDDSTSMSTDTLLAGISPAQAAALLAAFEKKKG
ncbi:MAG: hypothetical protein WC208_17065 [Gallionella sp.]|jgi:hypothetical protein